MQIRQILPKIRKKYLRRKELSKVQETLKKNEIFARSKAGKTCFIIANGPSIKGQDLKLLANKNTFVMNSFWLHPEYKAIRPKYYVVVDTPNIAKAELGQHLEFLEEDIPGRIPIVSSVPETNLFFSTSAKEYIEKNNWFTNNPKYYLYQHGFIDEKLRFNIDPTKAMPFSKNTVLLSLMLAVYMGFETIYLLGCDHDFLVHPSDRSVETYRHFYQEPSVFVLDKEKSGSYETMMVRTLRLFQNYRFFKEKVFRFYPKVKIYNATPNSFLDVFPMVKFEDIKL